MFKATYIIAASFFLAAILGAPPDIYAQTQLGSKIPITTTVTVLGPKFTPPPPVAKQDVTVYTGSTRLDVTAWVPAQGDKAGLQLAIVIDNSANQFGVGGQLGELANFITMQSKNTAVGIFYAANGTTQTASGFSRNHEAVAKKLRLPLGSASGTSPSIYLSLSDLVKHWQPTGSRREILLIASGIDRMNPGPQSPYVQSAIENVQKAGVMVHAIYTDGANFGETFRGEIAQGNLVDVTSGTGGDNFYDGLATPVSSAPFLQQLDMVLHNQYLLTFVTPPSDKPKGELRAIRILTEQHNVVLQYPKQVFVQAAK